MENLLITSNSTDETFKIGFSLKEELVDNPRNIFLFGDLGAGKTVLIKSLGKALGVKEEIVSPSFQLINCYKTEYNFNLIHIDLYRLKDIDEIIRLDWLNIISGKDIVAVEWAERAFQILPDEGIYITIDHIDGDTRNFRIYSSLNDVSDYRNNN